MQHEPCQESHVTLEEFRASLTLPEPALGLSLALQALWWDAHAYLHRKEGDLANAGYWYRRAGQPVAQDAFAAEWLAIAAELLARS